MSTPPATTEPTSQTSAPPSAPAPVLGPVAPIETAPSVIVPEGPTMARIVGFIGLFFFVLGLVVVVTTRVAGPRWVPESLGFVFGAVGLALMLYHAVSDGEQEIRRMYGIFAAVLLVVGIAFGLLPGPFESAGVTKTMGYYLLPWGIAAGLLSLMFAVPFTRHETDDSIRDIALYVLLGVGGALCVGVVAANLFRADVSPGLSLALAVIGVGFLCAYLSQADTTEGLGYAVAFTVGAVGAAVLFITFAWAVFPTVLHEGANVLRTARQTLDPWKTAGRALVILAFLGVAAVGVLGKFPLWLRGSLAAVGLITAGVFVVASLSAPVTVPPKAFLVPRGLILAAAGLVYLTIGLGVCSDSQFITLTRRELASYFFSPIGYLVLAGMAAAEGLGYLEFISRLERMSAGGRGVVPEPIVQFYIVALFPVFALTLMVPALTMRLFSEEKRTGSLEVLFTAPVSEWVVVLSKFIATWIFFMICWLPAALFLVALRTEGAAAFDYRPLLGFYLALAATGAGFVAMGLFFSSLTSNQIVAAVFTFVGMVAFLGFYILKDRSIGLGQSFQMFMGKLSYLDLWTESLSGQLPIRDVLLWVSLAVFFLFLSIKVLEIRRWK